MSVRFGRAAILKPEGAPFTQQQKEDLERLWKLQTNDTQDGGNVPDRIKPITIDCDKYMRRLHEFIFAFLKKHTGVQPHGQDTNNKQGEGRSQYLKESLRESCLENFYSRFVAKSQEGGAGDGRILRLNRQKSVIILHYEEFLSELNEYDFRGRYRDDDEICFKHCYGAYLYHHPLDALPALNVAMGLAIVSLWRLRNNFFSEREATTRNTNEVLPVDRLLDCCRINVRFVHVQPQVPMANIKTGLLKKLVTVKGHVVKARPRRLRVSTADL